MDLEIRSFELPPIGTQCYLVLNHALRSLAVFDAPLQARETVARVLRETGYAPAGLYLTHGHWDHTLDAPALRSEGFQAFAHDRDRRLFEEPHLMAGFALPDTALVPLTVDRWLAHGDHLEVCGSPVEVRHVPGHSAGSILFWFKDKDWAVAGDAVFQGSIGRTDLPGGSFEQLEASIREQIYTLPDAVTLYPGHGPPTTVGHEALHNPFVVR